MTKNVAFTSSPAQFAARAALIATIFGLTTGPASAGYWLSASATCNPQFTIEQASGSLSSVAASAVCPTGDMGTSASAGLGFTMKSSSHGSNQPLGFHTGSGASVKQGFQIQGLPNGVGIPITFNFATSGTLSATSSPRGGIAAAGTTIRTETVDQNGYTHIGYNSAAIRSIYGVPFYETKGHYFGSVEPTLANFTITEWDNELATAISGEDWQNDSEVRAALKLMKNPIASGFYLGGGVKDLMDRVTRVLRDKRPSALPISLDVQYGYEGLFSVSETVSTSSFLSVSLGTGVAPYPAPSEGKADFAGSVTLKSVSFQEGFDSRPLGELFVVMDDGTRYRIQQASSVPEPPTVLMVLAAVILAHIRHLMLMARRRG